MHMHRCVRAGINERRVRTKERSSDGEIGSTCARFSIETRDMKERGRWWGVISTSVRIVCQSGDVAGYAREKEREPHANE